MSGTKKSDNANMNFSASENSSTQILASNTVFHEGKTYFIHHKYDNYAASTDGHIINCKRLEPTKGYLNTTGYYSWSFSGKNKEKRSYHVHCFIWETFNQQTIEKDMEINHINFNKQDNCIKNLELVTRQQNMIHAGKARRGETRSKPQNIDTTDKIFYQHDIYTNYSANKTGQIYNMKTKRYSIGNKQSTGYRMIALSQPGLPPKTIFIHRFVYECFHGIIPFGMVIDHINSIRDDNRIDNLQMMSQKENCVKSGKEIQIKQIIDTVNDEIDYDSQLTVKQKVAIDKAFNRMVQRINKRTDMHFYRK